MCSYVELRRWHCEGTRQTFFVKRESGLGGGALYSSVCTSAFS